MHPTPGPDRRSFEGITTAASHELYPSGTTLTQKGHTTDLWKTTGRAIIVAEGKIGLPASNLHGLDYSCLIQTYFGGNPTAAYTSIKRDFSNLDFGLKHQVSFWQTRRRGYSPPLVYNVKVNNKLVFSTVPSRDYWVHVLSDSFTPTSTSVEVLFEISNENGDKRDRNIALNGISVVREGMCHICELKLVYYFRNPQNVIYIHTHLCLCPHVNLY
jgi:hypothetical protein